MIKFFTSEIVDRYVRENFQKLAAYLKDEPFRKGRFRFIEKDLATDTVTGYPADVSFPHQLGFQPKDVLLLSVSPDSVTVTPKYDSFTRTHATFNISAACTIRAYVGRYGEN